MTHEEVELLAIGAGPANLALAVAIEELWPGDLAASTLVIERQEDVAWQRGMLLPDAQSQVSFLKDLVTLRNPRSGFSFVNYLHAVGRLNEFINMGSFLPYRVEFSRYLCWVADQLTKVRLKCGIDCSGIQPRRAPSGEITGWLVTLSDGRTIGCRDLVIGTGRDPHIPAVFASLPPERVIHSTQYLSRIAELDKSLPYRMAVIGGAQSGAEMFTAVQQDLPEAKPTMIMRSIGLSNYESSKFTNELYFPSFVDEFFGALPAARTKLLSEMHRTNYAGLSPGLLDALYRQIYLDRMNGSHRLTMLTMTDVTAARMAADEIVLTLADRKTGAVREMGTDVLLLGTGFTREMPWLVRQLAHATGLDRIEVTRHYRLVLGCPAAASCYLQGVNEATHGIADSLLSVLAVRAEEIVQDILLQRSAQAAGPPVPASASRAYDAPTIS